MSELRWAEKAAWVLNKSLNADHALAFLKAEETIYYSAHARATKTPYSAVVNLIQGIYEHDPSFARRHVRNRIFTTEEPTVMCLAMIRVAARRVHPLLVANDHADVAVAEKFLRVQSPPPKDQPIAFGSGEPLPRVFNEDKEGLEVVNQIARELKRENERPRYDSDRAIAAVLVAEDGKVLSYGINTNAQNRTLHAEVNLLQSYYARTAKPVPARAKLYSSMKPCRMCAAMLWHMCEDVSSIRVFYTEFDPGPNAKETILDAMSFDRIQACRARSPQLLSLQLEQQA